MATHVPLHYVESGRGMPVVLLHGFPLSSAIWDAQRAALSAHYRVITPDLRGHGQSPAPAGVYDMEALARDVFALLDTLAIQQAVLMGHSMGGYATLAAWRLAPERFLALGLIASQAGADTEEGRQGRFKLADKVAAEGSKVAAEAMLPRLLAPTVGLDAPVAAQVRDLILNTSAAGIIGALKGLAARPDSTALLASVHVPVLVLGGAQDQIIPAAKTQALAAAFAKVTLVSVENAGHMPMLEQPDVTTTALRRFLDGIRS